MDLSFDTSLFRHPIIREHDYDSTAACALMTTGTAGAGAASAGD